MTRIRVVKLPKPSDIDVGAIDKRLQAFLLAYRTRKLAETTDRVESIQKPEDTADIPGIDWSEGDPLAPVKRTRGRFHRAEISFGERARIRHRANALVAARLVRYGLRGRKQEVVDQVMRLAGGAELVRLHSVHTADEIAAELHADFPWMASATTAAWRMLRTAAERGDGVRLRPLLLDGPPGIGKTSWAQRLAELVKVPVLELDATAGSAGFALVGTERGWGTAAPGRPVEMLIAHRIANPIIVVNEICKAKSMTSNSGTGYSYADSMLSLLEPVSAARWECPFYQLSFNMSHITWVLTSNVLSQVTETVRSRCQVVRLPPLTTADLTHFANRHAERLGLSDIGLEAAARTIAARIKAGEVISLRHVVRYLEIVHAYENRPISH